MNNFISYAFANLLIGALHSFFLKNNNNIKNIKNYKKRTGPGTVDLTVTSPLKKFKQRNFALPISVLCTTNLEFDLNNNFWKNNKRNKAEILLQL